MRDQKMTRFRFIGAGAVLASVCALLVAAAPASAGEKILPTATYPDMTTYSCRTDALQIYPGQNMNLFAGTKTCPHAKKVNGPGSASVFDPGSTAEGYITRFKPSMVEIKKKKGKTKLVTPSVWDLHLHHVVWIGPDGPTFASGEEKTVAKLPQGYGGKVGGDANWGLNYMIHSLNSKPDRRVYITWEIDWVPAEDAAQDDITESHIHWMDVAGLPQNVYPVFDAERGFDLDGDGDYTFPDEIPTDPSLPGYEERSKFSPQSQSWTVPQGGVTLVFGAGHLHPGGSHVDLDVARDGGDAGSVAGDDPSEIKPLFRSDAHYYEPAGAVSWDVSMEATRPDWRVKLKAGDVVSVHVTYDVSKASWYESMGILPLAYTTANDPAAKDPFDDAAAVKAMYDEGGILTHGRLPENIDSHAGDNLKLPNPANLKAGKPVPAGGIKINSFQYSRGGYSANRNFPTSLMRPPTIQPGQSVSFTNLDALPDMTQIEQAWHSVTSCKAPCNKGSGIGYPLAAGPIKFDSGQLGYGNGASTEVTTGSNEYTTPEFTKPGTYTYFCRIHPFMRGSIRVK
jgi:plastocyanin